MLERLVNKILEYIKPGYLHPGIYLLNKKETLNLDGANFELVNYGTSYVYFDGVKALPPNSSHRITGSSDRTVVRLRYKITFSDSGTKDLVIFYNTFKDC
ncbi:MAG: hypothetical protein AAFZ15_17320 [Bacteroidota bacterium]